MRFLFCTLLLLSIHWSKAQSVRFYVATDAPVLDAKTRTYQILQNSEFQISFTLENANGTSFEPPDFGNLTVLRGPMNSSEISIVNGKRTEKKSFIYTFVGSKPGEINIGKAKIRTSNSTLTTDPFSVVVKRGGQKLQNEEGKTIVVVEVSDTSAYLGQQIILELKLYTQENVKKYEALTDFNFDGFFVRELNEYSRKSNRIIKDGEEFFTTTLKAVALFPQQTGSYDVPEFAVRVGIPKPSKRRLLFSFPEYNYKVLNTEPLTIGVEDVPFGAPLTFSGGVGQYSADFKIDKKSVSTDDNITLIMEIRGNGDGKKVLNPFLDLGSDFEVYDPNLLRDEEYIDRSQVINYKSYEFLIVPNSPGSFRLTPEFTYFNPDSNDYITIRKNPGFPITVVQGKNETNDLSGIANRNLAPPMLVDNLTTGSYRFMGSITYWTILSLIGFGILGMFVHQWYLEKQAAIDPAIKSRKKANKIAIKRLQIAANYKDKGEERAFYDEITKALLTYLEDKLTINVGSLSKENLQEKLNKLLPETKVPERTMVLLQKSELALFAGGKTGQMEDMYQNALDIIGEIEDFDRK